MLTRRRSYGKKEKKNIQRFMLVNVLLNTLCIMVIYVRIYCFTSYNYDDNSCYLIMFSVEIHIE